MRVAAILVGAGKGERLSESAHKGVPKAFVRLSGACLLVHAARGLASSDHIEEIIPVVPPHFVSDLSIHAPGLSAIEKVCKGVSGGSDRQDSVLCGLEALSDDVTHVAVHDAARPLVLGDDVSRVVQVALEHGAAILASSANDSMKRVIDGMVADTLPRGEGFLAQTPQVFRIDWLREALADAALTGYRGRDDAELVQRLGFEIRVVAGDRNNLKITYAEDLVMAESLIMHREEMDS